ncbi:hypothetical protein K488DRAFT_30311, partial [Vararia minispora EC-137]
SPDPSRAPSPLPFLYSGGPSSTNSDSDSESSAPVLSRRRRAWPRERPPRWWSIADSSSKRRRSTNWFIRHARWASRLIFRLPCCPRHPFTILLTFVIFSAFAVALTFTIIYILNPDKEALPWRAYCAVPVSSFDPPPLDAPVTSPDIFSVDASAPYPSFPPADFDSLSPAGVFLGVFSIDSSVERRMLIRNTWASHQRSRGGAGAGDDGHGTSRTIVRFVLGQPRKTWERRIMLEMEQYGDIVILPMSENMNGGKSNVFFTWAATMAWVPPVFNASDAAPRYSYSGESSTPPVLAAHDPVYAHEDAASASPHDWVRPDFVVKADDDSFVMLAELEARLRVTLHAPSGVHSSHSPTYATQQQHTLRSQSAVSHSHASNLNNSVLHASPAPDLSPDPLVYWGYLVKQRFMAGELYALSWPLVTYAATDDAVKTQVRGAEDKITAGWMRGHPRADEIRWVNERCWIYDHPKSGTVYSHGFLFPSEAARVRKTIKSYKELTAPDITGPNSGSTAAGATLSTALPIPREWTRSTVTTFGTRYAEPIAGLSTLSSVEALVEGSVMSQLHEGAILTPEMAWRQREGRTTRYEGKRLGGTVVVHFIKKNMWYLETALALLGGDEETALER